MRLPREANANAALPQRPPQAFVADYDDVVGAAARGAEDGIRPLCQRLAQAVGNGIDRLAGRPVMSPHHVSNASRLLTKSAGVAIMAKGAHFAAEACQGALDNVARARTEAAAWRRAGQGPTTPARAILVRQGTADAQRRQVVDGLGAAGAAAMAATLLSSSTLLGALVGSGPLLGAALVGGGICAAAISRAVGSNPELAEQPAAQRALGRLAAGGSWAIGGVVASSLALLGAAGVPAVTLATTSLGAAIGLMGTYGLAQAYLAHDTNQTNAGRCARVCARLETHSALAANAAGTELAGHLRATFEAASAWGVRAQIGGMAMVVGLVLQLAYLWPGVITILLGSVLMEYSRFRRNALLPPLQPELPALSAAPAAPLRVPSQELLDHLLLRTQLHTSAPRLPTDTGRRLSFCWQRPSNGALETRIGELGGRAERTFGHVRGPLFRVGVRPPALRHQQAHRIVDGLDALGLGPAFSKRMDANEEHRAHPDPSDERSYRKCLRAGIFTLWADLPDVLDARIGDAYQRLVTHPDIIDDFVGLSRA